MLPRLELLRIAEAHARSGARFLRVGGVPVFRSGMDTDLLGLFIPASSYYATLRIESMTTYCLRDAGLIDEDEMRFFNEIDKVQLHHASTWADDIQGKIHDLEHE